MLGFCAKKALWLPWVGAAAISLSGCASTIPVFDVPYQQSAADGAIPTANSIVTRIRCELAEIASGRELDRAIIRQENIVALVELSLTVTDDGAIAPTATFTNGVFSFGTGFKFDQSRAQNFTENLSFTLSSLQGLNTSSTCNFPPDTNLSGNLGLKTIWELANSSGPDANWNQKGSTGSFGGSIIFTVDKEISATGPTWKLKHFTGPGSFLSAYDKNVDKLTIGFGKGSAARASAQAQIDRVKLNQQTDALLQIANTQRSSTTLGGL